MSPVALLPPWTGQLCRKLQGPLSEDQPPGAALFTPDAASADFLEAAICGLGSRTLEAPSGYKLLVKTKSKAREVVQCIKRTYGFHRGSRFNFYHMVAHNHLYL